MTRRRTMRCRRTRQTASDLAKEKSEIAAGMRTLIWDVSVAVSTARADMTR
jgi:hypothetical protein